MNEEMLKGQWNQLKGKAREKWGKLTKDDLEVVQGRAEDQETECYGVAVAKALAPPPVAAEWCLPLVHEGGIAVLWAGPTADREHVARVAGHLAAELDEHVLDFIVLRKLGPTPAGFPRRAGVARKRPLR